MRRIAVARGALIAIAAATLIAACASPAPTPRPAAATPVPSAPVLSTPAPAAPSTAPASPGASPAGGVVEDPSLIAVLPSDVDGVPVNLEHQAFVDASTTDAAFARNVARAAFGVAVDGSDLVSGVVAELQPGRFNDTFFRDWRDSYNDGACGQSGGVIGNAEAQIAGRTVYIATCAGDLRTYHAWLPERGAIVSAFALGGRRLGETLMEGLRP